MNKFLKKFKYLIDTNNESFIGMLFGGGIVVWLTIMILLYYSIGPIAIIIISFLTPLLFIAGRVLLVKDEDLYND